MNHVEAMATMLRYRRPHRSKTERKFIQRFLASLGNLQYDKYGNRYIRIGNAPIMYSSHTDTVHGASGLQEIAVKGVQFKLHRSAKSNCLGADNGAGVWLMRELILAKKPGLYIFHRGEECGGLGSRFLVKNTPELVKDIKAAIAFDRRGTKSIITHQFGGRCCSEAFAESMAKELNLGHKSDSGGTFTDTASYTDLIPECTNISVGFQSEHTSRETLDMMYLSELREAMLKYNWENLVIKRKAGEYEPRYYRGYSHTEHGEYGEWYGYSGHHTPRRKFRKNGDTWEEWDDTKKMWLPERRGGFYPKGSWSYEKETNELSYTSKQEKIEEERSKPVGFLPDLRPKNVREKQGDFLEDGHELDESERPGRRVKDNDHLLMLKMIGLNPNIVVMMLEDYGVDSSDLADYIQDQGGEIPYEMYAAQDD